VRRLLPILICAFVTITGGADNIPANSTDGQMTLAPRSFYDIPLAKLSVSMDVQTGKADRVKITFPGSDDQVFISRYDDMLVKNTTDGRTKMVFREQPDKAFIITDFEAKQMSKVCKTFIATLDIFEKDLQKQHWGRCLYLDSYFPHFLKNFYYMICAARNSPDALSRLARISESEYDVSENSTKSDMRINYWRSTPDYVVKLRIITKELLFQLKEWQKNELNNSKRNPEFVATDRFEEALSLFVRIYFHANPPVPPKKLERR
jgi:hypothetical protein